MAEITAKEARQRSNEYKDDAYYDCWVNNICCTIRSAAVNGERHIYVKHYKDADEKAERLRALGFEVSVANGGFHIDW